MLKPVLKGTSKYHVTWPWPAFKFWYPYPSPNIFTYQIDSPALMHISHPKKHRFQSMFNHAVFLDLAKMWLRPWGTYPIPVALISTSISLARYAQCPGAQGILLQAAPTSKGLGNCTHWTAWCTEIAISPPIAETRRYLLNSKSASIDLEATSSSTQEKHQQKSKQNTINSNQPAINQSIIYCNCKMRGTLKLSRLRAQRP